MKRITSFLSAVGDALIAVGVVLGIPLAVFSLLWLIQDGMTTDMGLYLAAASAIWFLANGVGVSLTADLSALTGASEPLALSFTLVPLALTLIIVTIGYRSGRTTVSGRWLWPSWLGVAAVLLGVTAILHSWVGMTGVVQLGATAWVAPVAVYTLSYMVGSLRSEKTDPSASTAEAGHPEAGDDPRERVLLHRGMRAVATRVDQLGSDPEHRGPVIMSPTGLVGRMAATLCMGTVAGAALALTVTFVLHWADMVTLFESLHVDVLGVITVSIGQLLYVPDAVLWAVSWVSGVGFSLGSGSSVTPAGTQTGPIPAIPVLGALPPAELSWGFVALIVPLLAAALTAIAIGPRYARALASVIAPWRVWAVTSVAAVLGGAAALGVLTACAAGSLGIGRYTSVGPDALAVFGAFALEFAVVLLPATAYLLWQRLRELEGMTAVYTNPVHAQDEHPGSPRRPTAPGGQKSV